MSRIKQSVPVIYDTIFNVMIINLPTAESNFMEDMHSLPNSNTCILFQTNVKKLTTLKFCQTVIVVGHYSVQKWRPKTTC